MAARFALLVAVVLAAACRCETPPSEVAIPVGVSLFDPAFEWTCSPDEEVGCEGVFPVRDASSGESPGTVTPITGPEALGVRLASLAAAQRSIRIQALIFRADETGLAIAELLKQRKADGLDVRVIVDAASNLDWQTQWMYFDLKRNGVEVEGYEALYLEWLTAEKLYDPLHANKRFHDKLWIVDGEDPERGMAIVGGLNLANEYFRVATEPLQRWRDQDVLLRGPVVQDPLTAFDRNYDFFKGIKGRLPRVLDPDNAWKLSAGLQQRIASVDVPTWTDTALRAVVDATAGSDPGQSWAPLAIRFLHSRPRVHESYILQAYLAEIENAERSILVANAYFIPSRQVADALVRATLRGVEVVVLTNSPASNDIAQVATMSRHGYRRLMREDGSGVKIHEWIGPAAGEGTLHAKMALFDERELIVGSYNLDPRSERLNSETAIAIRDPGMVAELARRFREEMLPLSEPITFAQATSFENPPELASKFELLYAMPLASWL